MVARRLRVYKSARCTRPKNAWTISTTLSVFGSGSRGLVPIGCGSVKISLNTSMDAGDISNSSAKTITMGKSGDQLVRRIGVPFLSDYIKTRRSIRCPCVHRVGLLLIEDRWAKTEIYVDARSATIVLSKISMPDSKLSFRILILQFCETVRLVQEAFARPDEDRHRMQSFGHFLIIDPKAIYRTRSISSSNIS